MADGLGQAIIEAVERRGWYVVNVFPSPDGSDGDECCSYTIGLSKSLNWPEIICFGRVADEAYEMLRLTIAECWERQVVPDDGLRLTKVLRKFPAKLVRNDAVLKNYLGLADWYAGEIGQPKPERLQLMWPDRNGLFPDDEGCELDIRAAQAPRLTV
jgi:hypothetical protein